MFLNTKIALDTYHISPSTGFLPEVCPANYPLNVYYRAWEKVAGDIPQLLENGTLRHVVSSLPVLSTFKLHSELEWRKAYVVLAFMAQAYIWGGKKPNSNLPSAISQPLVEVSEHLEINPCATFAVFCLWNTTIKPNTPLDNRNVGPDQIASKYSFTGTKDEEWFYVVSAAIEVQGGGLISLLLEAINAVQSQNARRLAQLLTRISPHLREISHILERMYEKCSPEVFYRQLRPFLAGSSKMSEAGLPQGIFYEDANGHGEWRTYSGGSNAQSSLIQLCDIVLGLDQSKANFTEEMRNYMPGAHKRFLEFMSRASTVREFIKSATEDLTLSEAYNDAVLQLVSIRTQHIQMVSRYILVPASDERQAGHNPRIGHTKGTGGTTLMPFLKLARDTTKEAVQFVPEVV